jgi:hypothetical protein
MNSESDDPGCKLWLGKEERFDSIANIASTFLALAKYK